MHMHELSLEIDIGTLDTVEVDTQPAVCLVVMQQMGPFNKNIYHNTNHKKCATECNILSTN